MLEDTVEDKKVRAHYDSYNAENDSSGWIGIGLADEVYYANGRNTDLIPGWIHRKENPSLTPNQEKLLNFYKATDKSHVSPYNVYTDSSVKAKIIKETIGYTKLKVASGVSTPIENCIPERVGEVFKRFYTKSLEVKSKYPDLFR